MINLLMTSHSKFFFTEFAAERAVLENTDFDDTTSVSTDVTQFSPHRHTPVVYERMIQRTALGIFVYLC